MKFTYINIGKIIFCIVLYLILLQNTNAQCISSGWHNATVFNNNSSIGVFSFDVPSDAKLLDSKRASASSFAALYSGKTNYLTAKGFNFTIPSYASICGITIEVIRKASGINFFTSVNDNKVKLIKNGAIIGLNKKKNNEWSSSDQTISYGGTNDLWGISLTPADVNDADFGIAFSAKITGVFSLFPSAEINYLRMKIDYNPILPVTLKFFTAEKKNNGISLQWQTTETEDGASIILQRKVGDDDWKELHTYPLSYNNSNQKYLYTDNEFLNDQNVQYRLKIILATGVVTYSDIRTLNLSTINELRIYPNPATDKLQVNATGIEIYDLVGRRIPVSVQTAGNNTIVAISNLTQGMYLLKAGEHSKAFIKQ